MHSFRGLSSIRASWNLGSRRSFVGLGSIGALALSATSHADVTTKYWVGPAVGTWATPSSWSPAGVPNNAGSNLFDVVIDAERDFNATVSLSGFAQIQNMWVLVGDALVIANNSTLALAGSNTTIDGMLTMNSAGNVTDLRIDAPLIIGGTGVLVGSNTTANRIYATAGTTMLTVGADLQIRGSMQLGFNQMLLTNHGVIDADSSSGMIVDLAGGGSFNDGTMRASNGGVMTIYPGIIVNIGGTIEAAAGSVVQLSSGSISGGVLRDVDGAGSGAVRNVGASSLADVTVQGAFGCSNNTTTYLYDGIDLQGPLQMNSAGNTTDVRFETSPFTVTGAGGIEASNTTANRIYGVASDTRLVIAVNSSVRGSMQLGVNQMLLTNHGVIDADASSGMVVDLSAGGGINDGTMRASNGGVMTIYPGIIVNTGGTIEAAAGSVVQLSGGSISGGVLRDVDGAGSGAVRNVGVSSLASVTVEGAFGCSNNTTTYLYDGIDLQGPLQMNSAGNTTDVRFETSPFTVTGAGGIESSNTTANRIYGVTSDTRLVIAANSSVRGSMQLGVNQMLLTNHGVIDADASSGIVVDLSAGGGINDGTMRASNGGVMTIHPGIIVNTGGTIEATAGSVVQLSSGSISGGVLRDVDGAGSGAVRNVGASSLANVTVQGAFGCSNNTTTYLYDGIDLQGPLQMNSAGNVTDVRFETSPFTVTGEGGMECSNTQANRIYGSAASTKLILAPGHTLSGSCQLGVNQLEVRNEGTILANASSGMTIDPTDATGFTNVGLLHLQSGNVTIATGAFVNEGSVQIDAGRTLSRTGAYTQTAGSTTVSGVLAPSQPVALLGGTLRGNGQVSAAVTNTGGSVEPGTSAGTLSTTQAYVQGALGRLAVEIGGALPGVEHDVLAVTGTATLAGTLSVARIDGFSPADGQTFVILTSTGARTGTFSNVESCDPVTVLYGTNSVSVQFHGSFGQPADLNNDGVVNGADLGLLLGGWGECGSACCAGDLNGDSVVNGADLGVLLGNWS
jgi:fibronectin-binding autotransporter adhesin